MIGYGVIHILLHTDGHHLDMIDGDIIITMVGTMVTMAGVILGMVIIMDGGITTTTMVDVILIIAVDEVQTML